MSVSIMAAAWTVECEPTQKLVLLALADHANDENFQCWPSLTHICKKTNLGRSTVARSLRDLEAAQVIERRKRGQQTTVYVLRFAQWCQSGPSAASGLVPQRDQGSATAVLGVVPERDQGSATAGPGTIKEPSGEPSMNRNGRFASADRQRKSTAKKGKRRDELFEAIAATCGIDIGRLTKTARGSLNRATKELREVAATPEEVTLAADAYRKQYPDCSLTPTALAKHWSAFSRPSTAESEWDRACRLAKEHDIEPFRGHGRETQDEFLGRVHEALGIEEGEAA